MPSLIPSSIVLGTSALVAVLLTMRRPSPPERTEARRAAARVLAVTVMAQAIHFLEETATGFRIELGEVLGLPAMPLTFFVIFNTAWLVIWVVCVPAVRRGRALGFFAAWFLAITGMLNGVLHPALVLSRGRYFPGVISSPGVAAASIWLWIRLCRATEPSTRVGMTVSVKNRTR